MLLSISAPSFLLSILKYKYFILYLLTMIEGPTVSMAAGFLISLGLMNPVVAVIIVVAGDMSSDLFFYQLGRLARWWRRAYTFISRFNFESKKEKFIRLFERHGGKAIIFGKLTHSLAGIIFMGAGYFRIRLWRVMGYSFAGALIKAVVLIYIGYLAGSAYERYVKNFEFWTLILSIFSIFFVLLLFYLPRRITYRIIGYKEEDAITKDRL